MKKTEAITRYYETLRILRRSQSTISNYIAWVRQYIDFLSSCPADSTTAPYSWEWFWLFPASGPCKDPKWGGKLYHIHDSAVQKQIGHAIRAAKIAKKAGCHTLRHSFATHWLESAEGSHEAALLRLQRLLGHTDPKTTMIYLHLLKPKSDVPSPLDMRPERLAA